MLQLRNASNGVQTTAERLLGMKQVDASMGSTMNYGIAAKPITVASVEEALEAHKAELDAYNAAKVDLANRQTRLNKTEKVITTLGVQILAGGKSFFTPDGEEIQVLGGTRTSDRKTPKRKAAVDINADLKKAS